MNTKLKKVIGTNFKEFLRHSKCEKDLTLRDARLIPNLKAGDEPYLTSVLLSSFRLIKEFRRHIQTDLKIQKGGQVHFYCEVGFPGFDERIDGLMIIVKNNEIKDGILFEAKKGQGEFQKDSGKNQISKYLEIANKFGIKKLCTISGDYVSHPSQSPVNIKTYKDMNLYHLSWSYLLTVGNLLLFNNENNIEDPDQVEIMKEVIAYLSDDKLGLIGFKQMSKGWAETAKKFAMKVDVKDTDESTRSAVISWQQEEQDITLKLSEKLGIMVKSGYAKYKDNYNKRIVEDTLNLAKYSSLKSIFSVQGAASDILVSAYFKEKTVDMSVTLRVPPSNNVKTQVNWINKQFKNCLKKSEQTFTKNIDEYSVTVFIKNSSLKCSKRYSNLEQIISELKGREIRECRISQIKNFGKTFESQKKFVEQIENMMDQFYLGIVQNLKKWIPPAPQIVTNSSKELIPLEMDVLPIVNNDDVPSPEGTIFNYHTATFKKIS